MQNLLVAGGDRRSVLLAQQLQADGYHVETLGLNPGDDEHVHIDEADAVLFPFPFAVKGGSVPCFTGLRVRPEFVLEGLKEDAVILAGAGLEGYVSQEKHLLKRYTQASGLALRNAELSAEAAVFEAMQRSSLALMDMKVLVTGYGLFARATALRLRALGAEVWIAARRGAQRAQAIGEGMHAVPMSEMTDIISGMDMVMNTVPARILQEHHLKRFPSNSWMLELASAPYGCDADTARSMGVKYALLPGLPASYAPRSAAGILHDAVTELLGRCAE